MRLYDYAASGNCFKVRLLLALLQLEYERVPVDIFAGDTLTDAFGALNPLRETPVLELEDGRTLTQSNALLTYLGEGTAFLPGDAFARAEVASWLSFEQERVMGGIGGPRFRKLTGRSFDAARLETGRGALAHLDGHLAARDWLVGHTPTIADVGVFAYASRAPEAGLEHPPQVAAWLDRVRALPGFIDDYVVYPDNARPGASRSIYDALAS
jgi:glutathione S-transferase